MKKCLATLLLALTVSNATALDPERLAHMEAALQRAASFLAAEQDRDGAWRSDRYSTFRDGYALTPLAGMAMTYLQGYCTNGPAIMDAAVEVLVTASDGRRMEYPVYTASLSTLVLALRTPTPEVTKARERFFQTLEKHQFGISNVWKIDDLPYGGWGYTPVPPVRPEEDEVAGHAANISATLFALAALRTAGVGAEDPRVQAARVFIGRCFNEVEGGFFFSPCPGTNNKAGYDETLTGPRYRPYGSATTDGLRALVLCGADRNDPLAAAAAKWLEEHFLPDSHPGRFEGDSEVWRDGYYFYYAWSVAHALYLARARGLGSRMTAEGHWAEQLADALIARQRPDGSWANAYTGGREDEPLVATSFAASALLLCRKAMLMPTGIRCPVSHAARE